MRITKYTHACLRLEHGGGVLVIDPGVFSEPEALAGADAVLITHEHVDHVDLDKLRAAAAKQPALTVHTHPDVEAQLTDLDADVFPVSPGDVFVAAGTRSSTPTSRASSTSDTSSTPRTGPSTTRGTRSTCRTRRSRRCSCRCPRRG